VDVKSRKSKKSMKRTNRDDAEIPGEVKHTEGVAGQADVPSLQVDQ
jgi:hypothetical protein